MSAPDCSETFRQEAQDLLEQLEQALLDLEQAPDDRDLVDTAFRALHTIKGSGSMFGFERVAGFTHGFETAFDRVRRGLVLPSRELVRAALAAKDHIRVLIERPEEAATSVETAILDDLRVAVGSTDGGPKMSDGTVDEGSGSGSGPAADRSAGAVPEAVTWRLRFRLGKDALVNGTNPLLLLDELRSLGDCSVTASTDGIPSLEEMETAACYLGWEAVLTTVHPRSAIEDVFIFVFDGIELDRLDGTDTSVDAMVGDGGDPRSSAAVPAVAPPCGNAEHPATNLPSRRDASPEQGKRQGDGRRVSDRDGSLRVQAERLDELMDRVGELVISQARLTQLAGLSEDVNIKSVAEEIERLTAGLRDTAMGIRMVPIGSLFGRFRRLVHDLSRDLGKQVELVSVGEETELDKTMIDRLADPLVHLIRNAIDHGLESPEQRTAAGKSSAGVIRLAARYAGAEVLITVADDGQGLDRDRIRAKAEEQGLIPPGAPMADPELYQLLFHAGFSTAREVSAVSGRGVGMDVVKRAIDALRGAIDITTAPGRGTDVTIRLPLTLAIIDGLLVRVGNGRYAIPLSAVEECVELSKSDECRSQHRSFMNIRGDLVPFLRLRELFGAVAPPDRYQKVVIVSAGDLRVGLVVDQIIGSHQTVIKSLSRLHADVETFSGATILGDGAVALILDVPHLVEAGQSRERLKTADQEAA